MGRMHLGMLTERTGGTGRTGGKDLDSGSECNPCLTVVLAQPLFSAGN